MVQVDIEEQVFNEEISIEKFLGDINVTFNETPTDTGETKNVSESKDSD